MCNFASCWMYIRIYTYICDMICVYILIYIQQDATLHSLFYPETALHV